MIISLQELRKTLMDNKKNNPEVAKVYQAILGNAQLIAKEDGNREVESKDIIAGAKKEHKMGLQSKESGAPYNKFVFEICEQYFPKTMNEDETRMAIENLFRNEEKNQKLMGKYMGILSKEYGDTIDKGLASKLLKEYF